MTKKLATNNFSLTSDFLTQINMKSIEKVKRINIEIKKKSKNPEAFFLLNQLIKK